MRLFIKEHKYFSMFIIFGLVTVLIIALWIIGFVYANDFSVKTTRVDDISSGVKRVLLIFPHADDEALSSGGLISRLASKGVEVDWLLLTKGEKGNPEGTYDENLKAVRVSEAQKVASIFNIKNLIQKDYPDGGVADHKQELTEEIQKHIQSTKPDLVVTFDLAGLYGHPDHIATSEVVTEVMKENFPTKKLWYVSYPKKILDMTSLPEWMAKDPNFKDKRVYPTMKVWTGIYGVVRKIKAVYDYKSQKQSYIDSFPIKAIPLWFYVSLTPYEYFYEAQK